MCTQHMFYVLSIQQYCRLALISGKVSYHPCPILSRIDGGGLCDPLPQALLWHLHYACWSHEWKWLQDPHGCSVSPGKVVEGAVQGQFRGGLGQGEGGQGVCTGWRGGFQWQRHMPDPSPSFSTNHVPYSPWTYASKIVSVGPKRPIGEGD